MENCIIHFICGIGIYFWGNCPDLSSFPMLRWRYLDAELEFEDKKSMLSVGFVKTLAFPFISKCIYAFHDGRFKSL